MPLTRTDILALCVLAVGAILLIVAALVPAAASMRMFTLIGAGVTAVGVVGCVLSFLFTAET